MRSRSTTLTAALLVLCFGVSYSGAAECLRGVCSPDAFGAEAPAESATSESHCHPATTEAPSTNRTVPEAAPANLEHRCCDASVAVAVRAGSLAPTAPEAQAVPTVVPPLTSLAPSTVLVARAPPTGGPPLFRLHRALLL